ncbi:hypothetical protein M407DRAFT_115561 [Tulasnella calospora MUT 4182]|uniref:Uncharacterized protein n=1 Tax=Tulasnella calospora MUT 4182 TaxID=1051891 RepID=A0A0C3QSU6_9AGAM|nr:hypothetical protein M407DRAFT_115561 [Tulasnella calospora MUT 4182]
MQFLPHLHKLDRGTRAYSVPANSDPTGRPTKFQPYLDALNKISARTRTPLPSLVLSFAVLHEITAVVPLFGFFFGAKYLGVGEQVASSAREGKNTPNPDPAAIETTSSNRKRAGFLHAKMGEYLEEGEKWAGRVGRRYGWWGYEKGAPADSVPKSELEGRLAGDVANAVAAYALTKAILPLRVGLSLYLSPVLSRGLIEPGRRFVMRMSSRLVRKRPSP